MKLSLQSGDGFVFFNKRKNMVKILVWDRSGFVIYYKQLSKGTFELPEWEKDGKGIEITMRKLILIMEGVQLKNIEYRKRYCG
jgi:transposase